MRIAANNKDLELDEHIRVVCPECGKKHANVTEWRRHLNIDHEYSIKTAQDFNFIRIDSHYHECLYCHKWVGNANSNMTILQYHRFTHLPYSRTYQCRYCTAAYVRKPPLYEHLRNEHSERLVHARRQKLQASMDAKLPQILPEPDEHEINTEFYMRFVCPDCGEEFEFFRQWLNHINYAHASTSTDLKLRSVSKSTNYYCLICHKVYYRCTQEQLQRHRFTHLPYPNYFKCAYCTIRKNYKSEILRHFLYVHPDELNNAKCPMKKPVEWASKISDRLSDQLDELLKNPRGKRKQNLDDTIASLEAKLLAQKRQKLQTAKKEEGGLDIDRFCSEMFEKVLEENPKTSESSVVKIKTEPPDDNNDNKQRIISQRHTFDEPQKPRTTFIKSREPIKRQTTYNRVSSYKNTAVESEPDSKQTYEKYIHYLCPECGHKFKRQNNWRTHVFKEHNLNNAIQLNYKLLEDGKSFLCLGCLMVQETTDPAELQRHYFVHMPYQSYLKCANCGVTKSSKPKMLQHLHFIHGIVLEKDLNLKIEKGVYMCTRCGKQSPSNVRHSQHRELCLKRIFKIVRDYDDEENNELIEYLQSAYKRIKSLPAENDETNV